jgi:hypothetical protein
LVLTNSTVVGNTAAIGGGLENISGIFTEPPGIATINNSILVGNTSQNGSVDNVGPAPITTSASYNLIGSTSPSFDSQTHNRSIVADTLHLGPLGDYGGPTATMPPLADSPAIEAGSNALAVSATGMPLAADQRGLPRISGAAVDTGAVEYQWTPGDTNEDGAVNFKDLLQLAQNYGSSNAGWAQGDFNRDGRVGFDDVLVLAQNYGQSSATAAPASSPPAASDTLSLLLKARRATRLRA